VIIMIGATTVTVLGGEVVGALFPLIVGLLAASVAHGRTRLAPHRGRAAARPAPYRSSWRPASRAAALQPAS
jgi:uncharacterized membrane protein YfcA